MLFPLEPIKHRSSTVQDPIKMQIIEFCQTPRSLKEIMEKIEMRHRPTVMKNYLEPLIQNAWVELTIPDKPNSPKQQYRITAKGKVLLDEI